MYLLIQQLESGDVQFISRFETVDEATSAIEAILEANYYPARRPILAREMPVIFHVLLDD